VLQINPAVTLALLLTGNLGLMQGLANIAAQVAGAILGAGAHAVLCCAVMCWAGLCTESHVMCLFVDCPSVDVPIYSSVSPPASS